MTHDYKRHGTTTLFAALNTLTGEVLSQCRPRHTHPDWLAFLRWIDQNTPPDEQILIIATIIPAQTRDCAELIRRGVFRSVPELIAAIEDYVGNHHQAPKPFLWTAKASDILEKVTRGRHTLDKVASK